MGSCASTADTDTGGVTLGKNNVVFTKNAQYYRSVKFSEQAVGIPVGTLLCFDSKTMKKSLQSTIGEVDISGAASRAYSTFMPRLGIVVNDRGLVDPIRYGNASALSANDLECVSLVDATSNIYVATSSLGVTHVFKLIYNQPGCVYNGYVYAEHVAQGQLPPPPTESTNWRDANATNMEATAVFVDERGEISIFWMGRGDTTSNLSWTRQAPFDYTTGTVNESKIQKGFLANAIGDRKWRNVTAMQVHIQDTEVHYYFSTAFDGEDYNERLDVDKDQTAEANKKVFKSAVVRCIRYATGVQKTEVLFKWEGIKVEALMLKKDLNGKVEGFVIGSDDERIGSVLGYQSLDESAETVFVDMATVSSNKHLHIPTWKWGTSGMAPAGNLSAQVANDSMMV